MKAKIHYPRFNESYTKVLRESDFPITISEIKSFIEDRRPDYTIDPSISKDLIIENIYTKIPLICSKHGNTKFYSKWNYLKSTANGNTGQCKVCISLQPNSRIKIKKFINKDMSNHYRHPAKIIDDRFNEFDRIKTHIPLKIQCIECGYNKDKVSLNNFFAKKEYVDKSFRCTGCVSLGKYGYARGPEDNLLFKEFLKLDYQLSTKIIKGINPYKIYVLKCPNGHENEYKRNEILRKYNFFKKNNNEANKLCNDCINYNNYLNQKNKAFSLGYILLTKFEDYKGVITDNKLNYYEFTCKDKKHKFKRPFQGLAKAKYGCVYCKKERENKEAFNLFRNIVFSRDGIILPNQFFINRGKKIKCKCELGHEFSISYEKLVVNQWCPICNQRFGERMCRVILEHIFDSSFNSIRPDFLKNPITNQNLELDGYNEELKIAFEYQGKHHEREEVIKKDKLKVKICESNNITLLVIDEFKATRSIKKIVKDILDLSNTYKLPVINRNLNVDISSAFKGSSSQCKFERKLLEKDAFLTKDESGQISKYQGLKRKLWIKCKNKKHKAFFKTPFEIIYSGSWCNECNKEKSLREKYIKEVNQLRVYIRWVRWKYKLNFIDSFKNFKNENDKLKFICERGHDLEYSLFDFKSKYYNKTTFCQECKLIKQKINTLIKYLKLNNNLKEMNDNKIISKSGFFISLKESNFQDDSIVVYCNNINTHRFNKPINTVRYYTKNGFNCEECDKNQKISKYNNLIKSVIGENAKFIGKNKKSEKFIWWCGVAGHKNFSEHYARIRERGTSACCEICYPRVNAQVTEDKYKNFANEQNRKYTDKEGLGLYLGHLDKVGSRENAVWSCSNPNHNLFISSYSNMSKKDRDHWCPYCQNRKVRKKEIDKKFYEYEKRLRGDY